MNNNEPIESKKYNLYILLNRQAIIILIMTMRNSPLSEKDLIIMDAIAGICRNIAINTLFSVPHGRKAEC